MKVNREQIILALNRGETVEWEEIDIATLFYLAEEFRNLNGDPIFIDKLQRIVIKKYLEIPEDERRYCLSDMDSKDHGILFMIERRRELGLTY